MKYYLIVDIGNSQTELGVFDESKLIGKIRFETKNIDFNYDNKKVSSLFKELGIKPSDFDGGMIFSVVPQLTRLLQIVIKGEFGIDIQVFNPSKVIKSLKCDIDDPNEIGQDLLADIIGAIHFYGYPIVVSDLGTVTKNIVIDKDGVFQGVSFFPGLRTNANALSDKTAQLPVLKEIKKPKLFYGKNTVDAMSAGIYYGHFASIKRFMARAEEEFGYPFKKVITGGFSKIFIGDFDDNYIIDPDLVLKGMFLIFKSN